MNFRIWFESEYDKYRDKIEKSAEGRVFPFASWFPDPSGRVYLPFSSTQETEGSVDQDIAEILQDAGFTITDYRQGLATNSSKRIYKIGKVLNNLYQQEVKELEEQKNSLSQINYDTKKIRLENYWKEVFSTFQNSPYRSNSAAGQTQFYVVISSNIHDIGSMSTGRSWESCMDLTKGAHSSDVYCEVNKGGFVAYLIHANDLQIKKPLARIAIRRFDNKKGESIAMPEDTIYGNEIEGFHQAVQKWIDEKQGKVSSGVYRRKGGEYSDTFSGSLIKGDDTGHGLLKMLKFGLSSSNPAIAWDSKRRRYALAAMEQIIASKKRFSPKLLQKVAALISDPKNSIDGSEFAIRYPEYITQEIYDRLPDYKKDKFDEINPKFVANRKQQAQSSIDNDLDVDNPVLGLSPNSEIDYLSLGVIEKLLKHLSQFRPMPEKVIRHVVKFGRDVLSRFDPNGDDRVKNIIAAIVHELTMAHADTPTVIRFYQDLLPYYDKFGGLPTFGHAFAWLGINGVPFLPFLKQKLKEVEDNSSINRKYEIERYHYVIDSIENGTGHSTKYTY